jgi:hypothetical protein
MGFMQFARIGVLLFFVAAPAFSAPSDPPVSARTPASPQSLHKRCLSLLKRIRAEASAPEKKTALLRSILQDLAAENAASPDSKVAASLRAAEANLSLLEAGRPLPPPTVEETDAEERQDEDLRDDPAAGVPRPADLDQIVSAGSGEIAGVVFDGVQGKSGSPAVGSAPLATASNLNSYLSLEEGARRKTFLLAASKKLLAKLKRADEKGERSDYLAWRLERFLSTHPDRREFAALAVHADSDEFLHLIYTLRDGTRIDQKLGKVDEWSTPEYAQKEKAESPRKKGGGGGGRKKKSTTAGDSKKDAGGGGGGGGGKSASSGGSKKQGGSGHGGGGRKGGGGSAGGGAAGRSGQGKAAHGGSGRGVLGSETAGISGGASPRAAAKGAGDGPGARTKKNSAVSGGGARAGLRAIAEKGPKANPEKSVPLPKDFTTRGGSSHRGGGKGGADGGEPRLKARSSIVKTPGSPSGAGSAAASGALPPAGNGGLASAGARAESAAVDGPRSPLISDEGLRDAVAAHSAKSLPAPAGVYSKPADRPEAPEPDPSPLPFAAAGASALLIAAVFWR